MAEPVSRVPAATIVDQRMRPSRLAAYYVLVFLFMYLTSQLLDQLEVRFAIHRLAKIDSLIHQAFNFPMNFDDVVQALFSLLLSLLFALPVAWVYILTREEEGLDPALVHTIVVLCMAVTAVMIVIGNELARAFSLAGVVAAVRFRSTLDDARDAVYLLIAVAVGMACGTHLYHIAVWLGLSLSAVLLLLWKYKFGRLLRPEGAGGTLQEIGGHKGKKKDGGLSPPLSAEAVRRIEDAVEQQYRLAHWASLVETDNDKKKANAALVVEAPDPSRAQGAVEAVLSDYGGGWRLASLLTDGNGRGTLEYVGRIPKGSTPAELLQALRAVPAGAIGAAQFCSLKGLRTGRGSGPGRVGSPDGPG